MALFSAVHSTLTARDIGPGQIGLTAQSTMTAGYAYDSDGLRRSKTVGGQTTGFTWDTSGGLPLLLSTHKAGQDTAIIYGPGNQAVAQIAEDGTPSWYHHDQLGTIRLTTNAAGAETYRGSHSAYGAPVAATGTPPLLGYAGQYHDLETGYQYLRARYYDPATAQFLTLDPLTATTGEPYGYTEANPLNDTDPTGLCGFLGDGPCTPTGVVKDLTGKDVPCAFGENPNGSCRGSSPARDLLPILSTASGLLSAGCAIGGGLAAETVAAVALAAECIAVAQAVGTASNLGMVMVECGTDPTSGECHMSLALLTFGWATGGLSNTLSSTGRPIVSGLVTWVGVCLEKLLTDE